jgi:hypothetical protein
LNPKIQRQRLDQRSGRRGDLVSASRRNDLFRAVR